MITKYNELENEQLNEGLNEELIEECFQIGDTVKIEGEKGFVVGQIGDDLIIQVQGSTHRVAQNSKKLKGEKQEPLKVCPPMKFDKVSQKLLFEQYVKCGIFVGNTPVKIDHCYTKFSDFNNATAEQVVNVIIEGYNNLVTKNQIKIFEDVNDFANPDGYIPGVVIDESSEEVIESVMINAGDYTNALGDTDMVRVIRQGENKEDGFEGQSTETMPKAILRTLSV
jgi:hypothetical protein